MTEVLSMIILVILAVAGYNYFKTKARTQALEEIRARSREEIERLNKEIDRVTMEIQNAKINYDNARRNFNELAKRYLGGPGDSSSGL